MMVILKSNKDLYMLIHRMYGNSAQWLSGMAIELGVSYNTAQHLAQECGYYRHRLIRRVELDEFSVQPYAAFIIRKKGLEIL